MSNALQKTKEDRREGRLGSEKRQSDKRNAKRVELQELSPWTPQLRTESSIQERIRLRMSLARCQLGRSVCQTDAENKSVSERTRVRQAKRKRGFDRFLQTINAKRQKEGQEELCSYSGTSRMQHQGKVMGYHFSLPFKRFSGDVAEIRKGCYNWTSKKESKRKPSNPVAPPRKAAKLSNAVSDAEVDSYLLKPHEILLKKLCMEKLPISEERG